MRSAKRGCVVTALNAPTGMISMLASPQIDLLTQTESGFDADFQNSL
jgi:hypothetical protein